jgi:orotidine-5'-phosphate decarboxylase
LGALSGCQAVVCSPLEAAALRAQLDFPIELICPGVRPPDGSPVDDQTRVATPFQAIAAGATRIVVGRPITRSEDVGAAARAVRDQALAARSDQGGDERAKQPKALDAHGRFDGL